MIQTRTAGDHCRDLDPTATQATDLIEGRLRDLHPEALAACSAALTRGLTPSDVMQLACQHLRRESGLEPAGSPLHFAQSAEDLRRSCVTARRDDP